MLKSTYSAVCAVELLTVGPRIQIAPVQVLPRSRLRKKELQGAPRTVSQGHARLLEPRPDVSGCHQGHYSPHGGWYGRVH
jgi:hypothetical protein